MIRGKGQCVICSKTTWNSKSGLCRQHWQEKAWGKEKEHIRIYPNRQIDGELLNTNSIF